MRLKSPIFILSSERSGTNLLRLLLDNHSMIHGPRAPHLLNTFVPVYPHYKVKPLGMDRLLNDIESIVNDPFIDWNVDFSSIKVDLNDMSFLNIWDSVYQTKLRDSGKEFILCKENNIFDYSAELKNFYNDAKFIFLYRDVRDVCASWMKVPIGFNNVSSAAINWNKEQLAIIQSRDTFGIDMISLSYEELIRNTPKIMSEVLNYLELPVESACFNTSKEKGDEIKWNEFWKNLGKKVLSENSKKYMSELIEDEIKLIETNAMEGMKLLSYKRDTIGLWLPPHQNRLHRILDKMTRSTAKPWFRKKKYYESDSRLEGFQNKRKEINGQRSII
jgi:hypothetical protein